MGISAWRQRAPLRQRVAAWRARNWGRILLAWVVLSLAIMAVAAEPAAPVARTMLHAAAILIAGGVLVLLAALP